MQEAGHRLEIRSDGRTTHLILDGTDISKNCMGFTLHQEGTDGLYLTVEKTETVKISSATGTMENVLTDGKPHLRQQERPELSGLYIKAADALRAKFQFPVSSAPPEEQHGTPQEEGQSSPTSP